MLDVGCGPGWGAVNYALGGADVYALDLTAQAVQLTKKHFEYRQVKGVIIEANAEKMPIS